MTVNSTRDFIPPEPFEGQNYKPRYARPSASLREEQAELYDSIKSHARSSVVEIGTQLKCVQVEGYFSLKMRWSSV